jgi:transcriptional regulator with XRE-family HTH domain
MHARDSRDREGAMSKDDLQTELKILGERLKLLRTHERMSQAAVAKLAGVNQPSVNRYENGFTAPPLDFLMWYADYFDVSLDYIFGRSDEPQGRLYDYQPQSFREKFKDAQQMERFVEYCFEPGTAANEQLKSMLTDMLGADRPNKRKGGKK